MNPVVLNIASGKWFPKGQQRLIESLEDQNVDLLTWDHFPKGCPTQEQIPYGFKVWAFREAQRQGYRYALWLDASVWAVKSLDPIWQHIFDHRYLFIEDGNKVGNWCSDEALKTMEISRDSAMDCIIPVGACIGLDLESVHAQTFLDSWDWYATRGAFNGPHTNKGNKISDDPRCLGHRHDIAVAGVILERLGFSLCKPPCVYSVWEEEPKDCVCVIARGM